MNVQTPPNKFSKIFQTINWPTDDTTTNIDNIKITNTDNIKQRIDNFKIRVIVDPVP